MSKVNNLIEWDYLGSHYSLYVRHFTDDDGRRGMRVIFEDVTREKVTEMVIPPRVMPAFLKAINSSENPYRGLF